MQAMLDEGYTLDGTAQALGWSRQLVTARAKILKLSETAQRLVGDGEIPVSAIDTLLAISDVSPQIAKAIVDEIAAGRVAGSQLVGNAGWVIGRALESAGEEVFGEYLNTVHQGQLASLRLGKKTDALLKEAERLHQQVERYAYGPPPIRFSTADVDQARAAGVLIELDRCAPVITDRALYRELAKQAIARTVEELRERAAAKAQGKRQAAAKHDRTPREELDSEHRATLRDLAKQAQGTNLDLGTALLTELATVAPDAQRGEVPRLRAPRPGRRLVPKSMLPAGHVRLQRALAAEARAYGSRDEELDKRGLDTTAAGAGVDDRDADEDLDLAKDADRALQITTPRQVEGAVRESDEWRSR